MSYPHIHRSDADLGALLRWIAIAVALVCAAVGSVFVFEPRADALDAATQASASESVVTPYAAMPSPALVPSPLDAPRPEIDNHPPTF